MWKRWQLFHAINFQSLMYPCFIFCRILGIFPYKINDSIFEASRPHYILSITVTCVLCVFELTMFHKFNIFTKITNFENWTASFIVNYYCIISIFISTVTLIFSSSRMHLLQIIMDISSRVPPESYQKLSRLIHAKDIFGFFYLISLIFTYTCFHPKDNVLQLTFTAYTILLVFQMDMLYINCVCILKVCFKEINSNLLHIQEFVVNNKPRISTMFDYKHRNSFLIINIKTLEKQYMIISNTVQMLNRIFSLQLLATIAMIFSEVIFELYFRIVQWHNGLVINLDEHESVIYLAFLIYYIIKMMLLVWACETGKNEAQEIRTTIHGVLNSTRDEQIKDELQLFSLQILHRKNIFSAKGLNVDAMFLATMTGTITTYMLILLQFLIISHSCDGESAFNIT